MLMFLVGFAFDVNLENDLWFLVEQEVNLIFVEEQENEICFLMKNEVLSISDNETVQIQVQKLILTFFYAVHIDNLKK
jgi:hypothetical protein